MLDKSAAFAGLIPDTIDLSQYLESESSVTVRPASHFIERTLNVLAGHKGAAGMPLPWTKAVDKFSFRPGEFTVWTGYKGHMKSMVASHVLLHGLTIGEKVFIISPEFKPEDVLARKTNQAACTSSPSDSFSRRFLEWAGKDRLWLFDHQGSLKPETVVAVTRFAIEEHGVNHVLIDSLMKCGIGTDDYNRQKRFVDDLQSIAHQSTAHVHLVAHARKGESDDKPARLHDVKGTSEICDVAENVISIWKNKKKFDAQSRGDNRLDGDPDALFLVDSQRNGEGWTGTIKLWFDPRSLQFLGEKHHKPMPWQDAGTDDDTVEF